MFGGPQGLERLDPGVVAKKRAEVKNLILSLSGRSGS
jgi:hypothetical protein